MIVNFPAHKNARPVTFALRNLRYPWDDMELGDFFDVPTFVRPQKSVASAVLHRKKSRPGVAFYTSCLVLPGGMEVTRVTRVPTTSGLVAGSRKKL